MRKEVKKWLNQLEVVAAVKAVTVELVKAAAVEVPVGPARPEILLVVVEITPPQKAKASK